MPDVEQTHDLLSRWHAGDRDALHVLLERDIDWLRERVHRALGTGLRQVGDTGDFVQEAAMVVLAYAPPFLLSSRTQFRAMLARMVVNVLRGENRRMHRQKRDTGRQQPLPSESVLDLDGGRRIPRPDEAAQQAEEQEWLRLGKTLLEAPDQEVLELFWDGLTDREIGDQLGTTDNTARMRRSRAVARLARIVQKLKTGRVQDLLREEDEEATS